jgi:drug/metabolite transporter (DMT)-like permease
MSAIGVGLLILAGGIGLVTIAETKIPSALTALVVASLPLWVVLLRLATGESVRGRLVGAVLFGFLGVGILLFPAGDAGPVGFSGLALVVLGTVLAS